MSLTIQLSVMCFVLVWICCLALGDSTDEQDSRIFSGRLDRSFPLGVLLRRGHPLPPENFRRERRGGPLNVMLERMRLRPRRAGTCSCHNGGTCLLSSEGLAWCICSNGHIGDNCQTPVEGCADRPCDLFGYGGKCIEEGVGRDDAATSPTATRRNYRCRCDAGYEGENCDVCSTGYYKFLIACIAEKRRSPEPGQTDAGQ